MKNTIYIGDYMLDPPDWLDDEPEDDSDDKDGEI